MTAEVDLLIVGAAPTGLMAALAAISNGLKNIRIVDKKPDGAASGGHYDGIGTTILDSLASYGLVDQLLSKGTSVREMVTWAPVVLPLHDAQMNGAGNTIRLQRASTAPFATPLRRPSVSGTDESSHAGIILGLSHDEIQTSFRDFVKQKSKGAVEVEANTCVESLAVDEELLKQVDDQDDSNVYPLTVALVKGEEREEVKCKYVIGCDGSDSWTRTQIGAELEDSGEAVKVWSIINASPEDTDFPDVSKAATIHSTQSGSVMLLPQENKSMRIYIEFPTHHISKDNDDMPPDKAELVYVLDAIKGTMAPFKFELSEKSVKWHTTYRMVQRVSSSYHHHQRIFIAGEACHNLAPRVGEGMDLSLQDALCIATHIAVVLKDRKPNRKTILDKYEGLHRRIALDLMDADRELDEFQL